MTKDWDCSDGCDDVACGCESHGLSFGAMVVEWFELGAAGDVCFRAGEEVTSRTVACRLCVEGASRRT